MCSLDLQRQYQEGILESVKFYRWSLSETSRLERISLGNTRRRSCSRKWTLHNFSKESKTITKKSTYIAGWGQKWDDVGDLLKLQRIGHKGFVQRKARTTLWVSKAVIWLKLPWSDAAWQRHLGCGVEIIFDGESGKRSRDIVVTGEKSRESKRSWVFSQPLAVTVLLGW